MFIYANHNKVYITSIHANMKCELSTESSVRKTFIILRDENRFVLQTQFGCLSARENNLINFKPWAKTWEQFRIISGCFDFSSKTIGLQFWNKKFGEFNNFGDLLSKYLVEKLTGCRVKYAPIKDGGLVAIGSMINEGTLQAGSCFWGTGILLRSIPYYAGNRFCAVRGPITRHMLVSAGYDCPDIFGDPALLLPQIYQPTKQAKKYKLGVICHWRHRELLNLDDDVKFIDILRRNDQIEDFIDEILDCEKILSSSLHGIIVANAYGIPARWFIVPTSKLEGDSGKKFQDYFSSVQMPMQIPFIIPDNRRITTRHSKFVDSQVDLKIDLNLLMASFPIDYLLT